MTRFEQQDRQSATWQRIRSHIEARIEALRGQLERDVEAEATSHIRGRIAELRGLLEAVEPRRVELKEARGAYS